MPPVIRAFISPEELYPGREVGYDELVAIATTLNRAEALHFLGFLNLLLSSATAESHLTNRLEPARDVQTWLLREIISERLLADLKAKFGTTSLLDRPLLHRTQLLFAIRLVATHGRAVGGNGLLERGDFDVIGDLLFLVNGLLKVPPEQRTAMVPLWVATQMGPLHELENPPALELAWPRIEDLLVGRLPAVVDDPAELERLERVVLFTSGFGLQASIDLSWLLLSHWLSQNYRDLMADRGRAYLNPDVPHEVISADTLRRALDGLAVPFQDLPGHLRIDGYSRDLLFDLTPFRAKPLWLMPDGLVLCIDAPMLMERLGPHVFWSVINALDTAERRHQFSSAWGLAFESYTLDALARVFVGKKWTYLRNPCDGASNEELWDGCAIRDSTVIAIECKGTFVKSADKYSGVPSRFFRGLTQKFGRARGGGVYQLVRGISRVWVQRNARPPFERPERVTDVFPVLVGQDPILECGPVARVLSDRFQRAMAVALRGATPPTPKVWPLTVVSANELDALAANIERAHPRLDSVLKRFHRQHPSRVFSLGDYLTSGDAREFGFPLAGRETLRQRFKKATEAALARVANGAHGGGETP